MSKQFFLWWNKEGSKIRPKNSDDLESFAGAIAMAAWSASAKLDLENTIKGFRKQLKVKGDIQNGELTIDGEHRDNMFLAYMGYLAYGMMTENKNFRGEPMPDFDDLPEHIQLAWINSAKAIRRRVVKMGMSAEAEV